MADPAVPETAAAAVGAAVETALAAGTATGPVGAGVATGIRAVLEIFGHVMHEYEIAKAQGEVLTGQQLMARSAERLEKAAADPGLPPEVRGA